MAPSATVPDNQSQEKLTKLPVAGEEEEMECQLANLSHGPNPLTGIPKFVSFQEHREHIILHMAAVFRNWARVGYIEGISGHISVRDPEFPDCICSNVSPVSTNTAIGPYFPRRGHKMPSMMPKNSARPIRPIIQMAVNVNLIEVSKGVDPEYDKAITAFYSPYHNMVNAVCRLAVEHDCLAEQAIALSAKLGLEGATLHFAIFPKFWTDLYQSQTQMRDSSSSGKDYVGMLVQNRLFTEYVETVLLEERVSLVNYTIYQCIGTFLPKVASTVLTEQNIKMMQNVITLMDTDSNVDNNPVQTTGTLRALTLVFDQVSPPAELQPKLNALIEKANAATMMNPKEDLNVDDDDDLEEDEEEEVSDEEEEINDVVDDDDDDDDEEEDEEEDDEDALRRIVNQEGQAGVKILGLKKNKESKHRSSQQ